MCARLYPEYYKVIDNPMDISTLQDKLKQGKYEFLQEMYDDLSLIWKNCKEFNVEGSDIYDEADKLQNFVNAQFEVCLILMRSDLNTA